MAKKKKTPKSSQQNPKNCVEKSSSKNADEKNPLGSNSHQMTKRDRQQLQVKSSFHSIKTTNDGIFIIDATFVLSDEKLKNVLSHIYEKGRSDAQKSHYYDHWLTCFSFAFTSAIPLLTAEFHDFWEIPGKLSKGLVLLLSGGALLMGIAFLGISLFSLFFGNKNKDDANQERDKAVTDAIQNLKLQAVTVKGGN